MDPSIIELAPTRTLSVFTNPDAACHCVTEHNPNAIELHWHHILPLGRPFYGPDEPANMLLLCPTTHSKVHTLLRWAVQQERIPSELEWERRRIMGRYAVDLASEGWRRWKE